MKACIALPATAVTLLALVGTGTAATGDGFRSREPGFSIGPNPIRFAEPTIGRNAIGRFGIGRFGIGPA